MKGKQMQFLGSVFALFLRKGFSLENLHSSPMGCDLLINLTNLSNEEPKL